MIGCKWRPDCLLRCQASARASNGHRPPRRVSAPRNFANQHMRSRCWLARRTRLCRSRRSRRSLGSGGLSGANDPLVQDDPLDGHRRAVRIFGGVAKTLDPRGAHEATGGGEEALACVDQLIEHAHSLEVPLRTGDHRIATKLVSRKLRFVDEKNADVLPREVPGAGGSRRARTDDRDVMESVGHARILRAVVRAAYAAISKVIPAARRRSTSFMPIAVAGVRMPPSAASCRYPEGQDRGPTRRASRPSSRIRDRDCARRCHEPLVRRRGPRARS